jgi:opacity protein-like surface antigen
MTINSLKIFLLLLVFPILTAESGLAQGVFKSVHGEWELSVFGGVSYLNDGVYATPVEGSQMESSREVGLIYGTGAQIGIRVADNHWQHWGGSLEYSFSNQPLTFTNLSDSIPSLGIGHGIHRVSYNVLYYTRDRDSRLRPYVFAGPGVSLFHVSGSSKDSAAMLGIYLKDPWKVTMNWGGGAKYLIKKQIAASFHFSDSISGVPGYGLPETGRLTLDGYVPGFRPEGLMHNWLIGAGFVFQWDLP